MADPQAPQSGAPHGVTFDFSKAQPLAGAAPQAAPAQPSAPSTPAPAFTPPQGVSFDFGKSQPVDPQNVSGEAKGDTGSTIIVPKDGESFQDTVKRATERVKNNPDEIKKEIEAESTARNIGTKTAETLGGAAAIGLGGTAALAAPGEVAEGAAGLYDLAIKHLAGNVLPGMETEAAKQTLLKAIPTVQKLIQLGIGYEGVKHLFKAIGGEKK
jgi:hypothetical protein